jgi:hypothetical protein
MISNYLISIDNKYIYAQFINYTLLLINIEIKIRMDIEEQENNNNSDCCQQHQSATKSNHAYLRQSVKSKMSN